MKQSAVFTSNAFVLFCVVLMGSCFIQNASAARLPNLPICCEGQTCGYALVDRKTDIVQYYQRSFKCQCGRDKWCLQSDIWINDTRQYKCSDWIKHDATTEKTNCD